MAVEPEHERPSDALSVVREVIGHRPYSAFRRRHGGGLVLIAENVTADEIERIETALAESVDVINGRPRRMG